MGAKGKGIRAGWVWVCLDCRRVFIVTNARVLKQCWYCAGRIGRKPGTVLDTNIILQAETSEPIVIPAESLPGTPNGETPDPQVADGPAPCVPDPQVDWNVGTATDLRAKPKTLAEILRQG